MKVKLPIALLFIGFLSGCHSDEQDNGQLEGQWQLVSRASGDYSPANTIDLRPLHLEYHFSAVNYSYLKENELMNQGTYLIKEGKKNLTYLILTDSEDQTEHVYLYRKENKNTRIITEVKTQFELRLEKK